MRKSPSETPSLNPSMSAPAPHQPYSLPETLGWIERAMKDRWYKSQMPVTWQAVDALIEGGLRDTEGREMNVAALSAFGRMIDLIENREIIFLKRKSSHPGKPFFIHLHPAPAHKFLNKMSPWQLWDIGAHCLSCGGNKWMPVMIDDDPCVLCYDCLPPEQYKSIRAASLGFSLIDEYAKQYYCM